MGLEGETPEGVNPDTINPRCAAIRTEKKLKLFGKKDIVFNLEDMKLHKKVFLPYLFLYLFWAICDVFFFWLDIILMELNLKHLEKMESWYWVKNIIVLEEDLSWIMRKLLLVQDVDVIWLHFLKQFNFSQQWNTKRRQWKNTSTGIS